jgi:pimeloyl-ACP methyl ester carboxylesterase
MSTTIEKFIKHKTIFPSQMEKNQKDMITNYLISEDNTKIAYYQIGSGPGVILVHGGMEAAKSHIDLAIVLSNFFTVYMYDRRGRGESDKFDVNEYCMENEVKDLSALITTTESKNIFGISTGALIVLQTLLVNPMVEKVVIYEQPLSINGSAPTSWADRMKEEIAQGRILDALITGLIGTQMASSIFNIMPRWLLKPLLNAANRMLDEQTRLSMHELVPTLIFDAQLCIEMEGTLDQYRQLKMEILLLGGSDSPSYLKYAIAQLEQILPNVKHIEFPKLGHDGSGNKDRGGKPDVVGDAMINFYKSNQ